MSVQQCPGRVARVTVDHGCEIAKRILEEQRDVTISGVECLVLRSDPPPPRLVNVIVYQYPHEFPNINVAEALDKFGAVKEVKYQHWVDVPEISTGSRVVRMVVEKDIPRFLVIRGIRCKVWYRDQPLTCDICRKGGHKASDCPDKGKCLLCHEPGHVARHCPNQRKKRAGLALSEFPPLVVGATDVAGEAGATGPIDVPPVSVDPQSVLPAGDLFHGLQHAADLDAGFSELAAGSNVSDSALAVAASVTEVVLNAFSLSSDDNSVPGVVVNESDASLSVVDEWFNQLDELDSQESPSILPICGPDGAPSGGEFVNGSQIVTGSPNLSNDNGSTLGNGKCSLSNLSMSSVDSVNCYGSAIASEGASPGPSIVDSDMTPSSDSNKRPISETSSDDVCSGVAPNSKTSFKKSKKVAGSKSHLPVLSVSQVKRGVGAASATQPKGNRLPSGVVSAVRLAVARVAKK